MKAQNLLSEDSLPWLTVAEIAETSKVTERTVRTWIATGQLTAHKHGSRVRIHRADYEAFTRR